MTPSRSADSVPTLPYKHRFSTTELDEIRDCYYAHGFAIIERVIPGPMVEKLKRSIHEVVLPGGKIEPGATKFCTDFVERSPACAELLLCPPYMDISRCLFGDEMSLNRSAAIVKNVGAPVGAWHTDWCAPDSADAGRDAVLNRGVFASVWLYLSGTHPSRGGLAIIPDSHTKDWVGPPGFEFTRARKSFYRKGTEPVACQEMDVPGVLPLFTEPGDVILFADHTYHGVFPHNGDQLRYSCGLAFRPGRAPLPDAWPLSESAQRFIASCPPEVQRWVEFYPGLNTTDAPRKERG